MEKTVRILCILYRLLKGEEITVQRLSDDFSVSSKTVRRDISAIRNFLSESREFCNNAELLYSPKKHAYYISDTYMLSTAETVTVLRLLFGSRVLSKNETAEITEKLIRTTTQNDRELLGTFVKGELHSFEEMYHDCKSVTETVFTLTKVISDENEITLRYIRMDRSYTERRVRPYAVIFNDFYFYLIASDDSACLKFFRADRIKSVVIHRAHTLPPCTEYALLDEYSIRRLCRFMFPGKMQTVRFEFSGPSVQSVLDRLPTAKIISSEKGKYLIEAETYGDGIRMYLLSQGAWVKVLSPRSLVDDIKKEALSISKLYS